MSKPKKIAETNDDDIVWGVRMPKGLLERIKGLAKLDRRSINSQIVVLLEKALRVNHKDSNPIQ